MTPRCAVLRRRVTLRPAVARDEVHVLRGVEIKLAIWLILPVVIRLSQRLSHACLSISALYCETANGSLYQS